MKNPFHLLLSSTLLVATAYLSESIWYSPAYASVAVELTVDDLVTQSEAVAVVTARSKTSRWEEGRIITYTTVDIIRSVAGTLPSKSSMVLRTLGGSVGNIGQVVHGEAFLPSHEPSLIFIRAVEMHASLTANTYHIVGLSQGILPVRTGTDRIARVESHAHGLSLLRPNHRPLTTLSIQNALSGKTLDDAISHIQARWNARKKKPI